MVKGLGTALEAISAKHNGVAATETPAADDGFDTTPSPYTNLKPKKGAPLDWDAIPEDEAAAARRSAIKAPANSHGGIPDLGHD